MTKFFRRVYYWANQRRLERELADEMEAHRDMMPPARRSEFGNTARLRELARDEWTWLWPEQFLQDLAYGARLLTRSPGFTLGATAVLALGIGVNLAEFQIFDTMIVQRYHFPAGGAMHQISRATRQGPRLGFTSADAEFYRVHTNSYSWIISEDASYEVVLGEDAGVRPALVSPNYFTSLQLAPSWGRLLAARDSEPDAPPAAVLTYRYWQTRFGSDPSIVGKFVPINGHSVQIVGIAPYNFTGLLSRPSLWMPISVRPQLIAGAVPPAQDHARASSALFGLPKTGISAAVAASELTAITPNLQPGESIQSQRFQQSLISAMKRSPAIAIFIVLVLLVLLSACANLGNMVLARGISRQREIAIRISIGAARTRILRQLMTENLLLGLLGSAAGLGFGTLAARSLLRALDAEPVFEITVQWPVIVFGTLLAFLATAIFGLPAALQTMRPNQRSSALTNSLIGAQVAVSCLLLIASGVLVHQGIAHAAIEVAFDFRNMVIVYPQSQANVDALIARLPGNVTTALVPPLTSRSIIDNVPGAPPIYRNAVDPSYFRVMQLPLVQGRVFHSAEHAVAVVSESAARAVWPNENPIGKTWSLAGADRIIVGIVKDSGANLFSGTDSVEAYLPLDRQSTDRAVIIHAPAGIASILHAVPSIAAELRIPISIALMRATRDNTLLAQRRLTTMIGSVGAVAATLSGAGMFALIAFAVAQKRKELGVRIAIGARPSHILATIFQTHTRPMIVGALTGIALAVGLAKIVRGMIVLQHHETLDPAGFAAGLLGFALVASIAVLTPAIRALHISPLDAVREE